MRILFIQETDWLIKTPVQQHHLAEMLSIRGHEIRAIDYELLWQIRGKRELYSKRRMFSNVWKIHQNSNITVIRPGIIKIPGLVYFSLVLSHEKEIKRQIKDFAPDVIVGFSILNSFLALQASAKSSIPFIYYWIDVLDRLIPFKAFQFIGRIIESNILKEADRVLAINENLKDYIIRMGSQPERTLLLRSGIDFEQFKVTVERNHVIERYHIGKDDLVLLFIGWLYNFSGLKEIARQLASVRQSNLKLLIVGEGDAYHELQAIQAKYNLHDRMILTGRRPYHEMPAFIAASDICLLPSYPWEPVMRDIVPIKLYEYMAMKKPVISTKLPGVMKEFGNGNGIVYVDRPEDIVEKACELFCNNCLSQLGAKARLFVEKNSWKNIADEFERILQEVIKEKRNERLLKTV